MRVGIFFLAGLTLFGQTITREGNGWVRTITGSEPVNLRLPLQVMSQGRVIVRGGDGSRINYKLVQRSSSKNEADAQRMLSGGGVAMRTLPGVMILVSEGSSPYVTTELTIEVPRQLRAASLRVGYGGDIEIADLDGGVQAVTPAGVLKLDRIGGAVSVKTGGGKIQLGRINGNVECSTGADSISIDSAGGQVKCETAGGEINVREAGGAVALSSEGGNILVGQAAGTVYADTRGGSIQVGSSRGVKLASSAGMVRVKGATGPLDVSTALGSILAELVSGMPMQDSSLAAPAGDITVLIPSNLGVTVMASSDTGVSPRIVSDFSEIHVTPLAFSRPPVTIQGAINGGGPVLRISSGRGVIYLRRAK
jgi:hypothetical protein